MLHTLKIISRYGYFIHHYMCIPCLVNGPGNHWYKHATPVIPTCNQVCAEWPSWCILNTGGKLLSMCAFREWILWMDANPFLIGWNGERDITTQYRLVQSENAFHSLIKVAVFLCSECIRPAILHWTQKNVMITGV